MLENDHDLLTECFYTSLEFGTGGLRGLMGAGTNRVNKYTIGLATQGLAQYIIDHYPGQRASLAIAYDSRNNSPFFQNIIILKIIQTNKWTYVRSNEINWRCIVIG